MEINHHRADQIWENILESFCYGQFCIIWLKKNAFVLLFGSIKEGGALGATNVHLFLITSVHSKIMLSICLSALRGGDAFTRYGAQDAWVYFSTLYY